MTSSVEMMMNTERNIKMAIARNAIRDLALAGEILHNTPNSADLIEELLRNEPLTMKHHVYNASTLLTNACLRLFHGALPSSSSAPVPLVANGKKKYIETLSLSYEDFVKYSLPVEQPLKREAYVVPKVLYNSGIYRNHVVKKAPEGTEVPTWNNYKLGRMKDLKTQGVIFERDIFFTNAGELGSKKAKKDMWRQYCVSRDLLLGLKIYEHAPPNRKRPASEEEEEPEHACESSPDDDEPKSTEAEDDEPPAAAITEEAPPKKKAKVEPVNKEESDEEEEVVEPPPKKKAPPKPVKKAEKKPTKEAEKKTTAKLSGAAAAALQSIADEDDFLKQTLEENVDEEGSDDEE